MPQSACQDAIGPSSRRREKDSATTGRASRTKLPGGPASCRRVAATMLGASSYFLASGKDRISASDRRSLMPANCSNLSALMTTTFEPSPSIRPMSTWMD